MLKVKISKAGAITITLPKGTLKFVTFNHPELEHFDEKLGRHLVPKFSDLSAFAKEVHRALVDEEEDGTTLVHLMFDKAILNAIENGAEGILLPDDPEYRKKRPKGRKPDRASADVGRPAGAPAAREAKE